MSSREGFTDLSAPAESRSERGRTGLCAGAPEIAAKTRPRAESAFPINSLSLTPLAFVQRNQTTVSSALARRS